jgi:hypothetical protein
MTFQEFAEAVCLIPDEEANPHFRSQHTFVCDEVDSKNVLADFAYVTNTIGICARLPHAADTATIRDRRSHRGFYDERLARIVGERYRDDAQIFGYSF